MNAWTQLVLINRGERKTTALAHAGLVLGFALLFFLFLLGRAGLSFVDTHILGAVPEHELTVSLKKKDVALFQVVEPGGKTAMSEEDLDRIRSLEGVRDIVPLAYGSEPSEAQINFMGKVYTTDMIVQGFPPDWIHEDVAPDVLEWEPGGIVPVVVNAQVLVLYNNGYAQSNGLPQLSATALKTPIWTLHYGEGPRRNSYRARIVGLSPKVALGAAVPDDVLRHMQQTTGNGEPPVTEAVLILAPDADTAAIRRTIDSLGYAVDEPHPLSRVLGQLHGISIAAMLLLSLCVAVFGFSYLNQTLQMLFLLKRRDYAVCRAMGMSRGRLRGLLLSEATAILAFDLLAAVVIGFTGAWSLHQFYLRDYLIRLAGSPLELGLPLSWLGTMALAILLAGIAFLAPRVWRATGGESQL
jgi:hypothetical protein